MGIEVLVQSFHRDFLLVFSRVLLEKTKPFEYLDLRQ